MLGKTPKTRPTKKDFYAAMDLMTIYTKQHPRSKSTAPRHARIEAEIQKRKALIAECGKAEQALYEQLLDALPNECRELLGHYGLMAAAPHAINKDTFRLFSQGLKLSNKALAAMSRKGK